MNSDVPTSNKWLLDHAANKNSQFGEDGIIAKILDVIGKPTHWCVEFGAWDGRHLSNTYDLISSKDYSAVLIEGSESRHRELAARFKDNANVHAMHAFVGFGTDDGLDTLLAETEIPQDFDLLSIDIDGNDYHAWKAVSHYRPRVVVIEYNPTVPSSVEFVQAADMSVNQGCSILSLKKLGCEKGYELVSVTDFNCIFVKAEYFERFGIEDNSVAMLRPNENLVTHIFSGYDGSILLRGHNRLPWIGFPLLEKKLQQVPRWLRQFPGNYGPVKKFLSKPYRSWRKRRS